MTGYSNTGSLSLSRPTGKLRGRRESRWGRSIGRLAWHCLSGKGVGTRLVATPECIGRTGQLSNPHELTQRDCLRFALPGFCDCWMFRDSFGQSFEVPVGGSVVISSATAQRRAVLYGFGPAVLADWLISDDLMSGRMVDLFPTHEATASSFETAAWLIYPSRA